MHRKKWMEDSDVFMLLIAIMSLTSMNYGKLSWMDIVTLVIIGIWFIIFLLNLILNYMNQRLEGSRRNKT